MLNKLHLSVFLALLLVFPGKWNVPGMTPPATGGTQGSAWGGLIRTSGTRFIGCQAASRMSGQLGYCHSHTPAHWVRLGFSPHPADFLVSHIETVAPGWRIAFGFWEALTTHLLGHVEACGAYITSQCHKPQNELLWYFWCVEYCELFQFLFLFCVIFVMVSWYMCYPVCVVWVTVSSSFISAVMV
jgi:hypothetical protein